MMDIPPRIAEKAYANWTEDSNGCYISACTKVVGPYAVYAQIRWYDSGRQRGTSAHRAAWTHAYGPIPDGMHVDHRPTCDRRCVNVNHLQLLTASENCRGDLHRWSGNRKRYGEGHHNAKLTSVDVAAIRAAIAGGESQRSVARRYGVSLPTIRYTNSRKTWKHVS